MPGWSEARWWQAHSTMSMDSMTSYDYHMTMRRIGVAEFKARLSEHLRYVRRGHVVTVLDRDTPIVRVVPHERAGVANIREPGGRVLRFQDVPVPSLGENVEIDVVALLLEERQAGR